MFTRWPLVALLCLTTIAALLTWQEVSARSDNVTGNDISKAHIHKREDNPPHGGHKKHSESNETAGVDLVELKFEEVESPFIVCCVVLIAALSKLGFHYSNFLSSIVPESCMLILVGTIVGAIIHFTNIASELPRFFTPHQFFIYLLPPIILEASYSLNDKVFYENLGSVLIFAVVATILNFLFIGLTLYGLAVIGAMGEITIQFIPILVFSSLIVAVDPVAVLAVFQEMGVNSVLYFLVFGESLLNDGVTVVLYNVMQTYNEMDVIHGEQVALGVAKFFVVCIGGFSMGTLVGCICAVITKFTSSVKVLEPLTIFSLAFLSYLLAEMFAFSGIISLIGCGLIQAQYAFNNITRKSKTTVKYFAKVASTATEIVIFLFLGLALVEPNHEWHTGFVLWTIFLCLIYRFIIVYIITFLLNNLDMYRVRKVGYDEQFIMSYGGLRGAVCFSLVATLDPSKYPLRNLFVTTTLTVVIFTVFIQGITIKPLVKLLQIKMAPEKTLNLFQELNDHATDHIMAAIEDIVGCRGKYSWKEIIDYVHEGYLKKWLQREPSGVDAEIKAIYEKVALRDHFDQLYLGGAKNIPLSEGILTPLLDPLEKLRNDVDSKLLMVELEPRQIDSPKRSVLNRRLTLANLPSNSELKKILDHSSSRDLYHSANYDRNLTHDEYTDIRHHIRMKHRRTSRMLEAHHFNSSRALSWNSSAYDPFYGRTPSEPCTDKIRQYRRNRTCSLNSSSSDRNWSFSNESSSGKHSSPLSVVPESQSVVESEEGTTVYNNFSYEHDAVDDSRSCTSEPTTPSKQTDVERSNSIGKYTKHKRPSATTQETEITLSIDEDVIDMHEKPT
ncbi:Na(+)/H(+) exchanger beta isoform X1 [Octopus sinensis]|uniref:Sodium/hydrogen exchanger n=1 Tax=Octopus sinensis TaxID=2607531 RepID=A0A6P7TFJ0_9MOLL|nr:Na(+)/H(+) exchanger beta isoform X1 [Octopus sinensis]